jgi:hypothetical protein
LAWAGFCVFCLAWVAFSFFFNYVPKDNNGVLFFRGISNSARKGIEVFRTALAKVDCKIRSLARYAQDRSMSQVARS